MTVWTITGRLLELPLLLHTHNYNRQFLQFLCVLCCKKVTLAFCLERPSSKWPILFRVGRQTLPT